MTKQIKAMQAALAALKSIDAAMPFPVAKFAIHHLEDALAEALAEQPAQQEPVAKHYVDGGHLVYPTAQRTWVGLTDDEIAEAVGDPIDEVYLADFRKFEAKLKEKNNV